jgi:hypothetical protein
MKKILFVTLLSISTLLVKAQFVLTPNDGLKTDENVYTIKRAGTELENYQAAKNAVKAVIPNAVIEEPEFEKVFTAKAEALIKTKVAGWPLTLSGAYTIKVETDNDKILISYMELGMLKNTGKRDIVLYPCSGVNTIMSPFYVFNSSGDLKQKKAKVSIEAWANDLVHQIEESLK